MKKNKPLIIIVSLLLLGALVLFINGKYNNSHKPEATSTQTSTTPTAKPTNMIEALNPNGPTVQSGEVQINTANNIVNTTTGKTLEITGGKLKSSSDKCVISNPSEFCIVASGNLDKEQFDVYFLKDALHSRLFENTQNFTKLNVIGSPAAGSMELSLNSKNSKAIVVTNTDSSGWMIIPKSDSSDNNTKLISSIKVN